MVKIKADKKLNYFNFINFLFIVIIFTVCLWGVGYLERIRVVDDGFCYWGIAANISGYDWTDLISASAYYSYGYSIILVPLFWLHRLGLSMTFIYRLAIVLNAVFLSCCYLMALYMIKELFKDIPDVLKQITALLVTLYIGNTAQMGLAYTEIFLLFMFWCTLTCLYRVISKPSYVNILGVVVSTAWLFAIHMRSIGVVIAVCIILAGFFISHRKEIDKKYILYTIVLSVVFLCLVIVLKNYVNDYIYLGNASESVNNVKNNVSRLGNFLSIKGIMDLIVSFIGKLFYVSTATFLLAAIGLLTTIASLLFGYIIKDKKGARKRWQVKEWITCFILLSFLAELGINSIFKAIPFFRTFESRAGNETIIFSRYSDFVVGPMIIFGVWAVYNIKTRYYEIILAVLVSIVSTAIVQFLQNVLSSRKGTDTVGFRFGAAPWFNMLMDGHSKDYAYNIMMLSIGILVVLCLIKLIFGYKWHVYGAMLIVLTAIWSVLGVKGGIEYTISKQSKEKSVDTVAEILAEAETDIPVYMVGGANTEVKILQWLLAERSIRLCDFENIDNIDTSNAVILANSSNTETVSKLSEKLDFLYDSGNISVFADTKSVYYDALYAKAGEMAHKTDPSISKISLSSVATEFSFTKYNGSLYYNYQGTNGGYMTKEMGVKPKDGIYEFTIDIRARDCIADTDIGYITAGYADGEVKYTKELKANDFIKKARQKVKVELDVKDYEEPFIGIYTYGDASIRIYGISYQKVDGCICLDTGETEEIGQFLSNQEEKEVYYVDSDNSGLTGFPYWSYGKLNYLSGKMLGFKSHFEDAYYIVEKTDMNVVDICREDMQEVLETEGYFVFY